MVVLSVGSMNKRVTLLSAAAVQDASGGVGSPIAFARVWAKVAPMNGSEIYRAQQFVSSATVQIVIRYRPGVLSNMIVQFQSDDRLRNYRILAVLNEGEQNVQLTLLCEEINDQ